VIHVRTLLSTSTRLVAWVVMLAAVLVLAATVVVPRLGGATPYTVLTGSMEPRYPAGTLVVVRPVHPDDVRVGDVVTIQLESGRAGYVTHRVVQVVHTLEGETHFRTQGDANQVADLDLRRPEQVRGRLWYAVPGLGRFGAVLDPRQREQGVQLVSAGLLLYAGLMFVDAARQRRRPSRPEVRE
jgi:signal peptidase